jgi:xanthine dehydrogenase YagS FAD-binding subunit
MRPFSYAQAADAGAALDALRETPDAALLAGGTTLIDLMKLGVMAPARLIDITALAQGDPALSEVAETAEGGVRIGALARMSDVAEHPRIREGYPVVREALLKGASAQLRNMATIGGNLLQRTRCTYFRDVTMPECNKRDPGSGCGARPGVHRLSAILGTSEQCIATHPSDVAVAFVALDAAILITNGRESRAVAADDFFLLPEETPERETALQPGEMIAAVELPPLPAGTRSHYLKVRDRESYEFALASAAVAVRVSNGTIDLARVALGGVGTKPWWAPGAEAALIGKAPSLETIAAASLAAVAGAKPLSQNAYKVTLARRTLERALAIVTSGDDSGGAP